MNRKLALLSLTLVAISLSAAAPAQAREAYFDRTCCCCDDQDTALTSILDLGGTQITPLYYLAFSNPTAATSMVVGTTTAPTRELSFDITYAAGDDNDRSETMFRTNSVATKSTGGSATVAAPGAVSINGNTFSASFSFSDSAPQGALPPVLLTFSGQLAPGVAFNSAGGIERIVGGSTDSGAYSLLFNLVSTAPGAIMTGQPLFSSFVASSDIVEAVPEPGALLLATLGCVACQLGRPRRRVKPH